MHSFAAVRRRRQPAEMLIGGLATLTGMVLLPLGQIIAWVAGAFLEWTILCVQATAALPFLQAVGPQFVVVFAGQGTRDKPSGELVTALSSATVLRTDERGTIEMVTEGRTLAIRTER